MALFRRFTPLQLLSVTALGLVVVPTLVSLIFALVTTFSQPQTSANVGFGADLGFGLTNLYAAFALPGFWRSVSLSLWLGLAATAFSVALTVLFFASFARSAMLARVSALISPILAVPHAAVAFGFVFLVAPSGFFVRFLSPVLGFDRPPDWLVINDPWGLSLLAGLTLKEFPFLFLMTLAALPQTDRRLHLTASTMGYGDVWGWMTSSFPTIYAQLRLPIIAVIAYSSSAVDMALILGPRTPSVLAVEILRLANDPDTAMRGVAAAAAFVQLGVTGLAILIWFTLEKIVGHATRPMMTRGYRISVDKYLKTIVLVFTGWSVLIVYFGMALLVLWSVAKRWSFPDLFPQTVSLTGWTRAGENAVTLVTQSAVIGIWSAALGLFLAIACLENEFREGKKLGMRGLWTLYLPLLMPQIVLMTGLSRLFLQFGWDANLYSVIFAHLIFVFPYVYLSLSEPWHAFDAKNLLLARSLGSGKTSSLIKVRLPMMLTPILTAFALGFAVSIAQYLPTLMMGAGRISTLTTEAIALSSGANRRAIGVYAFLQAAMPFLMFAIVGLLPAIVWRNRSGLKQTPSHKVVVS